MFQDTKLYLSFSKSQPRLYILKIFLKFRKFQPGYSYKIYSYKKKSVFHKYDSLSILVFIIISDRIWLISSNNIHTLFNWLYIIFFAISISTLIMWYFLWYILFFFNRINMILQIFISINQSGISLNLRTGPTDHATLFNQWEGALVFINKQIKTSPQCSKIFKTTDGVDGQN